MNNYEKYCVDDLMTQKNDTKIINDTILLLEYRPKTGMTIRQKRAFHLKSIGLNALADYLLQQSDYETFLTAAKQEQKKRLKNRPISVIEQFPYTPLEKKYQATKQKYISCQHDYKSDVERVKTRYSLKLAELNRQQKEALFKLERKQSEDLDKIRKEIQEIEHQLKLENDPKYAERYYAEQKRKQEEQRRKEEEQERLEAEKRFLLSFGIRRVDNSDRAILFPILQKLGSNERLLPEDKSWLETKGKKYFAPEFEIYKIHHRLEAEYYVEQYKQTKSIWNLVNASAHWRKAKQPNLAENLLSSTLRNKILNKDKKLKSAFLTTFGGVKRDLGKFNEGIEFAHEAHKLSPQNYRPCTLLGALYLEMREYSKGSEWFNKAEKLGAKQHNTDAEIKAIYRKANKEDKEKLKEYLLKLDHIRYRWLTETKKEKH